METNITAGKYYLIECPVTRSGNASAGRQDFGPYDTEVDHADLALIARREGQKFFTIITRSSSGAEHRKIVAL